MTAGPGLGEYQKFARGHAGWRESAGVQLRLRHTDQVSGSVEGDLDVRRAGVVLDAAIGVIAQNRHILGALFHIRVSGVHLVIVRLESLLELCVGQQHRHHRKKQSGAVPLARMGGILLHDLRVLIVNAGHDVPGRGIKYHQMVSVRPHRGFVLRHAFSLVDHADGAFVGSVHTEAKGVDRFDDGAAQGRFGFVPIDRRHLNLFVGNGVKGRWEGAGKVE